MTSSKTITLSAETLDESMRAFGSRLALLRHDLDMAKEYGSTVPVVMWSDLVHKAEAAQQELFRAAQGSVGQNMNADWYPLLRRMVLAQLRGDYEAGERFSLIMQEHGMPTNDAEFDRFMELVAKAMGARA